MDEVTGASLIVEHLRDDIVSQRLKTGARLPSRLALTQRFGMSAVTVQRAVDVLVQEGFLRTEPRVGTFVAPRPPHLSTIGLVYPVPAREFGRIPFFSALRHEALVLGAEGRTRFESFYGINHSLSAPEENRISDFVLGHRLRGIILAAYSSYLPSRPWFQESGLRCVVPTRCCTDPTISTVDLDYDSLGRLGIETIARAGSKRLAFFARPGGALRDDLVRSECARLGLVHRDAWRLVGMPDTVGGTVGLLFSEQMQERPDGLVVLDDTLLEPILCALAGRSLRIGTDLKVVAHANLPEGAVGNPLIPRIGFDAREVLVRCTQALDEHIATGRPAHLSVLARREDDPYAPEDASVLGTPDVLSSGPRSGGGGSAAG